MRYWHYYYYFFKFLKFFLTLGINDPEGGKN